MAQDEVNAANEDLAQIRESVRALCAKFPGEYWRALDRERAYPTEFVAALTQAGFLAALIPEEYGGSGLSMTAAAAIMEEIQASGCNGAACHAQMYTMGTLLRHGSAAQKARWLPAIVSGELRLQAFGVTEPTSGSDTLNLRTTAVREGDHYLINGVKRFITAAGDADFMQLMVATDRTKGSRGGISCFIVDMDAPGVKLGACYETMMGDKPWEIVLENVRVPASHRVGAEGEGMRFGQQWLNIGRVKHGARALGVAERCIEMATSYAKQRSTFGRPLAERQAVQWMLADMFIELQAARLLVYRTAARLDQGEEAREDAYVAKYYADEMAFKAADQCMQIHGGIALTTDLPIEKMWRQQRSYRITEGASEVMKMVIARHVLKAYG
jgi:alkylation response protein AidB-like acyl-CoA dehydrogenase